MAKPKEKKVDDPEKLVVDLVSLLLGAKDFELEDVTLDAGELTIEVLPSAVRVTAPQAVAPPKPITPAPPKVVELARVSFEYPKIDYPSQICEVQIGATKAEGGSRGKTFKIGGEASLPFYRFEKIPPFRPIIALDTFDLAPPLARPVKDSYKDVLEDPAAWAKLCVEKYKADLASLHLVSTDPGIKNTPASQSVKLVEDVLQAVNAPLIVGGSGNPVKDVEVFTKIAEATAGEKLVFGSVTVDMDIEKIVKPIVKHGHNLIALAFMDVNQARELCRKSLDAGLPKTQLILDPTTGSLGYGIEYSYSIFERIRLSALMGEDIFQVPLSSAATNAWVAREAWQKIPSFPESVVSDWGPRELRGPIWEAVTALICMLCGADIFMMMHPLSAELLRSIADIMSKSKLQKSLSEIQVENWVKMKV